MDKNRINVKSKRKRYLFKKAIELSQMCDLQIAIIVRDKIFDRLTTYCSGKISEGIFSAENALDLIKTKKAEKKTVKMFTDDDYNALDANVHSFKSPEELSVPKRKRGRPKKNPEDRIVNKKRKKKANDK